MSDTSWTNIVNFGTRLEAEIAQATLQSGGVPVLLRGEQSGVFGPGFQGWAPGGATLAVPAESVSRARELLDLEAEPAV